MQTKVFLPESELPTHWYNVLADMPNKPAPYLGPDGNPVTPDAMMRIFPEALVMQEMTTDRWVEIPERCARPCGCGGPRRSKEHSLRPSLAPPQNLPRDLRRRSRQSPP